MTGSVRGNDGPDVVKVPDAKVPDVKVIEDLATLRVLSDPLRLRLLERLGERPSTVKALAAGLGLKPNRLYYHVNLLEQHGLVRVTETHVVSGIVERTYGLAARQFVRDPNLVMPVDAKRDLTDTVFRMAGAELSRAIVAEETGGPPGVLARLQLALTDDQRASFEKELAALLAVYDTDEPMPTEGAEPHATRYVLVYALYAATPMPDGEGDE